MIGVMLKFFSLMGLVASSWTISVPFILKCKTEDNACLIKSTKAALPILAKGLPELGVKSFDPLVIPFINGNQKGLKLTFNDSKAIGLSKSHVEEMSYDTSKNQYSIVYSCTVNLEGTYSLDGNILDMPVVGEGKYQINVRDIQINLKLDLATVKGQDGKDHWHIASWTESYRTRGGADFNFMNLFQGNQVAAKHLMSLMNENSSKVMEEVAPPIVHALIDNTVAVIEEFFKAVPLKDIIA